MTIRVLIADDHPLLRSGLRQVLAAEPDFAVPGEAEDSEQAIRSVDEQSWDAVVLDLSMPGRGGFDTLREIRRRRPDLPVLILSMHSEERFGVRAIRSGAQGYLVKTRAPGELVQAIRRLIAGKRYVTPTLAETLADSVASGERAPHEALSDREFQVMCAIARGQTVSAIGRQFSLSTKTVSTYRSRALEKMKMRTNAELTRYAIENGLAE